VIHFLPISSSLIRETGNVKQIFETRSKKTWNAKNPIERNNFGCLDIHGRIIHKKLYYRTGLRRWDSVDLAQSVSVWGLITRAYDDNDGFLKADPFFTSWMVITCNMQFVLVKQPLGRCITKHNCYVEVAHRLEALQTQHYWTCFRHLVREGKGYESYRSLLDRSTDRDSFQLSANRSFVTSEGGNRTSFRNVYKKNWTRWTTSKIMIYFCLLQRSTIRNI
jgi:hypothetical protein